MARKSTLFHQEYDPEVGLWVVENADAWAHEVKNTKFRRGMLKRRKVKRTIYDQFGKPVAEVRVDEFGNSHHEFDHRQDATARPDPIKPRTEIQ